MLDTGVESLYNQLVGAGAMTFGCRKNRKPLSGNPMKIKTVFTFALLILAANAQTPTAFEVISVRQTPPASQRQGQLECSSGGHFVSRGVRMGRVILWAFSMRPFQVSGMPAWIDSTDAIFEIEAKSGDAVSEVQCKLMVQTLLADRFKLLVQHLTQEIPAYALVVARNGPKMRQVQPDDKPRAGGGVRMMGNPVQVLPGEEPLRGWSMAQLAETLTGQPAVDGRPVLDRTELKGIYEIDIDFAFRRGFAGDKPDIFDAVQEQLGLKLDSVKAPFDMIKIDRLERPDAN
jgi:uncharacterized protein (TIGR03435 family)